MKQHAWHAMLLFCCGALASCANSGAERGSTGARATVIPSSWVNAATRLADGDYQARTELVAKLASLVWPGKLPPPYSAADSCLSMLSVNLDQDPEVEQLIFVGRPDGPLFFCVLKRAAGAWRLLYSTELSCHNPDVEVVVLHGEYPQKVFRLLRTNGSGTGIYDSSYDFFRVIEGRVRLCLSVPARKWNIWSHVETTVTVSGEDLVVKFDYHLHPTVEEARAVLPGDRPEEKPDCFYVTGSDQVRYEWNQKERVYEPWFDSSKPTLHTLTAAKVQFLTKMPTSERSFEKALATAFAEELQDALKNGTPDHKHLVEHLLRRTEGKHAIRQ